MSSLAEKIRKSRERLVEVGEFTFTILRPTHLEWIEMKSQPMARAVLPYVVGWKGVREIDVIPGGNPTPVEFDSEVAEMWLADRMDVLPKLIEAVVDAYVAHLKAVADVQKN